MHQTIALPLLRADPPRFPYRKKMNHFVPGAGITVLIRTMHWTYNDMDKLFAEIGDSVLAVGYNSIQLFSLTEAHKINQI